MGEILKQMYLRVISTGTISFRVYESVNLNRNYSKSLLLLRKGSTVKEIMPQLSHSVTLTLCPNGM